MIYTQYKIKSLNDKSYRVCWLDKDIKEGSKITLKGEEGWFRVIERYGKADSDTLSLNRNPNWYSLEKEEDPIRVVLD